MFGGVKSLGTRGNVSSKDVLIVGSHVCKELLAAGYRVRGTVRSKDKGEFLKDLFKGQEFDYVIAEDITHVSD